MKHTIHTPTEPYGFVETEFDGHDNLEVEASLLGHQEVVSKIKNGADAVGMETKEFNRVLDELLTTGSISGDPGMIEEMNVEQQAIIQAVKRSRARTNKN